MKTIYIASSWKNQHAVEMLTALLRAQGHEVLSWVENNYGENPDNAENFRKTDFESWMKSGAADHSFTFDTYGAMTCGLFIYLSPAGKDAAAECGMAYGKGVEMIALYSKAEDFGLMRKMFSKWFNRYTQLLDYTKTL